MGVRITAKIIEARDHLVLEPFVDNVLAPEVPHPILDPLKIRNRHAASISQNVRNHKDAFLVKNLVRRGCSRSFAPSASTLHLLVGILRSDLIFSGCRHQNVAIKLQQFLIVDEFHPLVTFE